MKAFIQSIASQLQAVYPAPEAIEMAWWIAEELTGLTRSQLLCGYKGTTNFPNLQEIINRLIHFEPIQYIFGHTFWNGLELMVTPATLIPRPETAELIQLVTAAKGKQEACRVLDIGTGSGCIAVALKKKCPEWLITAIDISAEAIAIAQKNSLYNDVDITFITMDVFSDEIAHLGPFDIIVSNPPYICENEKIYMRDNVLKHEPKEALFVPDNDPLLFYRRISELHLGSLLFLELNEAYVEETSMLLKREGYRDIAITKDIYGKERFIQGRMA